MKNLVKDYPKVKYSSLAYLHGKRKAKTCSRCKTTNQLPQVYCVKCGHEDFN